MATPAKLVRSPDFWFNDGTVILQVENTLYRVYRGLLASRSTIFQDTFSVPQPAEEAIDIEGCPVVQLHDNAEDFTLFLKVLHSFGTYKICPVSNFGELSAVLHLSDKYDVTVLRHAMISILSDLYPNSLKEWAGSLDAPTSVEFSPVVMYEVCTHVKLDDILSGAGKFTIENDIYQRRCVLGYPRLELAQRHVLRYLTREEEQGECETTLKCDAERLRWVNMELKSDEVDPLADSKVDWWDGWEGCSTCLEAAKETYHAARQKLWDELPTIFKLGTWEELRA
ncbi:Glutamine amidotransferase type-1 domain-containing protein [Mycena venus]|uniref:Glutamine amidotransferase type-1 domain-containing protein n=1 Tax=Mycena venus TaxID=2733690 RepID=A0A8H6X6D5_9AGAR|nr:Glutamine amidotransferase type-1 domain-containing protein [Mycena venus]